MFNDFIENVNYINSQNVRNANLFPLLSQYILSVLLSFTTDDIVVYFQNSLLFMQI